MGPSYRPTNSTAGVRGSTIISQRVPSRFSMAHRLSGRVVTTGSAPGSAKIPFICKILSDVISSRVMGLSNSITLWARRCWRTGGLFVCLHFLQHVFAVAQAGFFGGTDVGVQGKAAALSGKPLTPGLQFFIAPAIPFQTLSVGVLFAAFGAALSRASNIAEHLAAVHADACVGLEIAHAQPAFLPLFTVFRGCRCTLRRSCCSRLWAAKPRRAKNTASRISTMAVMNAPSETVPPVWKLPSSPMPYSRPTVPLATASQYQTPDLIFIRICPPNQLKYREGSAHDRLHHRPLEQFSLRQPSGRASRHTEAQSLQHWHHQALNAPK
nr:MAG TPA_asm: hypothetical protein [Caudoviricetes sp.]